MPGIAFSLFRAGIATMISTIKQTNERMQAVMASRIVRMPDFCSANRRDCSEPSWDGFMIRDKQASPPVMTAGECVQVDQQPLPTQSVRALFWRDVPATWSQYVEVAPDPMTKALLLAGASVPRMAASSAMVGWQEPS